MRQKHKKSGHDGIAWEARNKKWRAQIKVEGRWHYLGYYVKLIDAVKIVAKAKDYFTKQAA